MKHTKTIILVIILASSLNGCATIYTVEKAQGLHNPKQKNGKEDTTPHPAAYAFLPLAVIADIPTIPLWALLMLGTGLGIVKNPM